MADAPPADLHIDESFVRTLLREHAPMLADRPLAHLTAGWDNEMWRLGDDLLVRLPRREMAARLVEGEIRVLPMIAERLATTGVAVPTLVLAGAPDPSLDYPWTWSVLTWIPGHATIADPRASRTAWAAMLAHALRALHVPADAETPQNPLRGVPLAMRDEVVRARLSEVREPDTREALMAAWRAGMAAPAYDATPVMVHGDLHPANVLTDAGDLAAIVDFGDVSGGDPAVDLATGWLTFNEAGRRVFRATYASEDDALWTRARAWAASMAASLLNQSDDRPEFRRLGEETAAEIAADV